MYPLSRLQLEIAVFSALSPIPETYLQAALKFLYSPLSAQKDEVEVKAMKYMYHSDPLNHLIASKDKPEINKQIQSMMAHLTESILENHDPLALISMSEAQAASFMSLGQQRQDPTLLDTVHRMGTARIPIS